MSNNEECLSKRLSMHGEKKDNLLSEKIFAEVFSDDVKINQKSSIDSTSCSKPEGKVRSSMLNPLHHCPPVFLVFYE